MGWLITKYLITAAIVVAVSQIAKKVINLGANSSSSPCHYFGNDLVPH